MGVASLDRDADTSPNIDDLDQLAGTATDYDLVQWRSNGQRYTGIQATQLLLLLSGATESLTLEQLLTGHVDARIYGVGKAGNTAAQNTTALQAAMTAAAGKTLVLPAGTISLTASTGAACVTAPTAGIRIIGQGKYNTILSMANTVGAAHIAAVDADKFEIEHVGFTGGAASAGVAWQRPLVLRGVQLCMVSNCYFYQCGGTPLFFGTEGLHGTDSIANGTRRCEKVLVDKNVFVDCFGTIAVVTKYNGASDFTVTNNLFINACAVAVSFESQDNLSGGATAYNFWGERCVISGNVIYSLDYQNTTTPASVVSYGISISESVRYLSVANNIIDTIGGDTLSGGIVIGTSPDQTDEAARVISITGNIINAVTSSAGRGHGILFQVGDTNVDSITISGNTTEACEVGLTFMTAYSAKTLGDIKNFVVTGNTFNNCTEFGIWCDTLSSSGDLPIRNGVITGNTITQSVSHGISIFAKGLAISGNKIMGCGGAGINLLSGSHNLAVTGNHITDCSGDGVTGDGTSNRIAANIILRCGQTNTNGYGVYFTSGTNIDIQNNTIGDDGVATLAIGSTKTNVAYAAFKYYIGGTEYSLSAQTVGVALGTTVVPINKYGCIAFEVGTNGTVDVIEASANSTGYNTAALALAGLPAKQASHVRFGYITVIKTDGGFTFGTTNLDAANVTTAYTSGMQDYGIRCATTGQTVRNNNLKGNRLATIFSGIAAHNTGTYDAGLNWTA